MKTGTQLITEERERQISKEGWTPAHDDEHQLGELCSAAGCYMFAGDCLANAGVMNKKYQCTPDSLKAEIFENAKLISWPFEQGALKIDADPIRSLVKAGALIAAEIDRIQRKNNQPEEIIKTLGKGLLAVADLIKESSGVAGLNQNGEIAEWADLRAGGRGQEWLMDFDAALELVAPANGLDQARAAQRADSATD